MPRKASIAVISPQFGRREDVRRRAPAASDRRRLLVLRGAWLLVVFVGDYLFFLRAVHVCKWPQPTAHQSTPFKLLIISDPQIPDHRSYPGRALIFRWLGQAVIDNYLRKTWRLVIKQRQPDAVIFNGDLLDSGHQAADRLEHASYVRRFRSIFHTGHSSMATLFFAGNHDTGLHLPQTQSAHAREQFRDAFGPLHGSHVLGDHAVIWIDSMALLEERARARSVSSLDEIALSHAEGEFAYVRKMGSTPIDRPRLLFSHIPLYRPPDTDCGGVRESDTAINPGRGLNYQNLVDEDISRWVLEQVKPVAVFSGDDHDACVMTHTVPGLASAGIMEHTVRSLSMAMGVADPGYELVSLFPRKESVQPSYSAQSCMLPYQIGIYTGWYLPLLALTILFFGLSRLRHAWQRMQRRNHSRTKTQLLHHRTPSFLDYAREATATLSDPEDMDEISGYVSSPLSHSGPQYSYHHGVTDDEMPTPAVTPLSKSKRPSVARVRRVSRVWLWDGRSHEGRDAWAKAPPALRALRRTIPKLVTPVWTTLQAVFASDPVVEIWTVIWPSLVLAVALWIYFW